MVGQVAPVPVRREAADSCPGVLRPHLAADGALARVRVPGGAISGAALRGLGEIAAELADAEVGLTSRGNLQVRGVAPESVGLLEARLAGLGLLPHPTHERVRNIVASPLAGRGSRSIEDVDGLVTSLDAALCARADLAELPGRFLFGLDDGTGDIAAEQPDVLVVAVEPGRFEVRPAGAAVGVLAGRARVVDATLTAAGAFLAERARRQSQAWRVNELAGAAEAMINALAAEGLEPVTETFGPVAQAIPEPGLIEQKDGRLAVCAVVPLGILDGEQVEALAACGELTLNSDLDDSALLDGLDPAEHDGLEVATLRVTPWRRIVVRDLELPAALAAQELLAAVGLVVEPASAWARVTACAGQPGCAKSLTDVKADARAFAEAGPAQGPLVHWVGCGRACGTPHGATVLIAAEGGYRVAGDFPRTDLAAAASSSIGMKVESL